MVPIVPLLRWTEGKMEVMERLRMMSCMSGDLKGHVRGVMFGVEKVGPGGSLCLQVVCVADLEFVKVGQWTFFVCVFVVAPEVSLTSGSR
jgi:hypothetical protein